MCVHISLSLHMALHLHSLFVGDICIVLRDCGLFISVLLGLFVFVFVIGLADLRQRQAQTQTKSKNSFHSDYLIYLNYSFELDRSGACLFNTVN